VSDRENVTDDVEPPDSVSADQVEPSASAPPGDSETRRPEGPDDDARVAVERILRDRARVLAHVTDTAPTTALSDTLLCRLGEEHYAIEMTPLRSIQRATGLTPVPCTPAFVAGVLNVRGEMLTVLDLGVALGLRLSGAETEAPLVLTVEGPQARVGLLVDEVLGLRRVALDQLDRLPNGTDVAHGVAEAHIVVVNLERLLGDGRFEVLEEVG
jgi:purine-binding chemotaxis protein CheW